MASKNQTPPSNNRNNNNRKSRRNRDRLDVYICYVIVVIATCHVTGVGAGSRMVEPPTRASLWRYGYGTPINFDDDEVMCGGYNRQYGSNGGRCGVCGDPWDEPPPRRHEAGGVITPSPRPARVYQINGEIPVFIDSTADLVGQYEFRLCKLTASNETPDQDCFDQTPLSIREAQLGQSYRIGQSGGLAALHLVLPENLTCTHCILQWRHVTGNRVNKASCVKCAESPEPLCNFCLGCGLQAWYQGCADIAIHDVMGSHPVVRGVRTQQELKDQWASTLQDLKQNCSCAGGGGDTSTSIPTSENAINSSQPYTVSATFSISPGNETVTQPFQTTSSGAVVNTVTPAVMPNTTIPTTTTSSNTQPGSNTTAIFNSSNTTASPNSGNTLPSPNTTPGSNSGRTTASPNTTSSPNSGNTTAGGGGGGGGSTKANVALPGSGHSQTRTPGLFTVVYPPQIGPHTTDTIMNKPITTTTTTTTTTTIKQTPKPVATTTTTTTTTTPTPHPITPKPYIPSTPPRMCYLPFRPLWYLFKARQWCTQHCPRSGFPCNYQICRTVRCPRPTPRPNRVRNNGFQSIIRFLLLAEAIADL